MSLYPKDIESKLSFDKIRSILSELCMSSLGQHYVENMAFSQHNRKVNEWMDQCREFIHILSSGGSFPQSNYLDVSPILKRSEVPGSFLDEEEFFDVKLVLDTLIKINQFFQENAEEYPVLYKRFGQVYQDEALYKSIDAKIDEKGELRDNASRELMSIRSEIARGQVRARTVINKVLKHANGLGYCPDGSSLTIREGRMVIPVLAEHKRHIKGFVHDESATGQTVYLEPAETLEINNELRELRYAERREVIRILTQLTDHLRENLVNIQRGLVSLGVLDFVRAKSKFAVSFDAHCPKVATEQIIEWKQARHPILQAALKEQNKTIKALDLTLSRSQRILLVSGPNAGGKSVCIKTVGLIQYMLQCGIPVPVLEGSKFGTFESLFLDIGDEQSIENDLSTYSSHLTNMKYFLQNANGRTLFLIDEFGTGTEPQFGGAIAEVVLTELNKTKAFGAITTHYGNLKKLADHEKGIVNGAMKFDVKALEPLYELEIGKPGSSFALEIAGKIGLDKQMLNRAKKKAGVSHVQFDRLLSELESEKNQLAKEKKQIEAKNRRLNESISDYEELKAYMEKKKDKILREATEEAATLLKQSNKQVEATIKQIKEAKADKSVTQKARVELKSFEQKISKTKAKKPAAKEEKPELTDAKSLQIGDKVQLKSSGAAGEVIGVKGKQVELSLGGLTSRVKMSDLLKISNKAFKKPTEERLAKSSSKASKSSGFDLLSSMADFSPQLDIRGVRADEAIGKVEEYIDKALLSGQNEVKILHGKGHGVLRELTRNVLKEMPKIISAEDEHVERGGAGITVVQIDN